MVGVQYISDRGSTLMYLQPPPASTTEGGIGSAQEWEAIARYRTTELNKVRAEADHWRMQFNTKMAEVRGFTRFMPLY